MQSLLYVSRRALLPGSGSSDVDSIMAVSHQRNALLKVTGALVVTPRHFAQLLEGTDDGLAELMASIEKDPRHDQINLIRLVPKVRRELARWSLAYHGESSYVTNMLARAHRAPNAALADYVEEIKALTLMFA